MSTKTDNHNLETKLALRRHFLETYHRAEPPRVLDCFQGAGVLWGVLRREFQIRSYWGVDVKPKAGRLRIDSVRILEQRGWVADVVDLDCYGSPWKYWRHLVRTFEGDSVTVLLTHGRVLVGGGKADRTVLDMMGCRFHALKMPDCIGDMIGKHALGFAIGAARDAGLRAVEVREAFPQYRARYIGIRLARELNCQPIGETASS